ncbi:hypothetical protein [Variovorax sp. ZT4R33]|uniref:hypothetical protein n=1 Tax=Variovorax sp. ZT4R33 TaxID=3443743 RepID=UPI003F48E25A
MNAPRTPPRFVPTLTTVLEPADDEVAPTPSADGEPSPNTAVVEVAEPAAPTAVVELPSAPAAPDLRGAVALDPATRLSELESFTLEEQLLHRVLQRVDLQLEERLSDVVAAAVQAQLDEMVPRLREEIEGVLRTLVTEALAQELQEKPGSNPPGTPPSFG